MSVASQHRKTEWKQEEPVTVLHEAALRSLSRTRQSILEDDCIGRVMEMKKFTDILTCLQTTLRTKLGRSAAGSLSDFYATMFTLTQEASQCESTEGLDEVINCITRVRDAWALSTSKAKIGKTAPQRLRQLPAWTGAMLAHI